MRTRHTPSFELRVSVVLMICRIQYVLHSRANLSVWQYNFRTLIIEILSPRNSGSMQNQI